MNNSARGPDNQTKKLFSRFPMLVEVARDHKNLGSIRVQRKSLKETQSLLKALPRINNIEFQFYDCSSDADTFGYERYSIFYLEVHIDNFPVFSQTVVHILKEEDNMFSKFTVSELASYENASIELHTILDAQVVDIDANILSRIFDRLLSKRPDAKAYLDDAKATIEQFNYSWDEALGVADASWGYNPDTGKWDGSYSPTKVNIPEDALFIHGFVEQAYLTAAAKAPVPWNSFLKTFVLVSKEEFKMQYLMDISDVGMVFTSSEDFNSSDGVEFEAYDVAAFVEDEEHKVKEIYFCIKQEYLPKLLELQHKTNNHSYMSYTL